MNFINPANLNSLKLKHIKTACESPNFQQGATNCQVAVIGVKNLRDGSGRPCWGVLTWYCLHYPCVAVQDLTVFMTHLPK